MRLLFTRLVAVAIGCGILAPVFAEDAPAKPKAKVELRWVETKRINDVTEDVGFQASDDPKDIVFRHKVPALVLTAKEVSEVKLVKHDLSKSGLGVHYTVQISLTKAALEKLAASCDGNDTHLLTVTVDGRNWGVRRYEKDKNKANVPDQARAATFRADVGFFPARDEAGAKHLVESLK